jgi:hypothetical protein
VNAVLKFVALLSLAGCATSRQVYLPDGSQGFSISCDGAAVGMNVCLEKAGQVCGSRGYTILNREGQTVYSGLAYGSQQGAQSTSFAHLGGFNSKSILVRCR